MAKGHFIAIYGVNNIGKSTHAKRLIERLKQDGYDAAYLKYPIYELEPTGTALNRILRSGRPQEISEAELQKIFAQNRKDFESQLRKMLADGKTVVAEDYTGTGIAWGMAKGLDLDFMLELNKGLINEDFAILMTGQRDARAQEKQHIHEQNPALLQSVSKIFVQLGQKFGWHTVELQPTIPQTAELIWQLVGNFLSSKQ